jgi:gamma-glutamyltranspeptidase/glutathione hydrolase
MVCAPQPEAVEAGCDMLRAGGNALDAAIACALVQGVVDPMMTGIAGFGSLQIFMPARDVHICIDFHGRCPAAATPEMWAHLIEGETRDGFGFILRGNVNDVGYQSISVPGSLKAYAEAHAEFGTLAWRDVLAPAIGYAQDGFVVRPDVHRFMSAREGMGRVEVIDRLRFTPSGRRIYLDASGAPHAPGARLRNPEMARTLRRIADNGVDDFYRGEIAREIDAGMRAHGGLLRYEDLASYRTTRNAPLEGAYRGLRVATNRPPGGGVMLIEMLNVLENFDLATLGHNSVAYIRTVAEAMKLATIDKDAHVGDPAFVDVPLARLTDKGYARELATRIRSGAKAEVPRFKAKKEAADTTQVCVVDEHGSAVTMTHTLGMPSGVITEGLGFMYNGAMGVFDPRPGRAGSIAPGKSRFSSMVPTIVFDGSRPRIVIGAPGGTQIVMGVMQAILNMIDHGMSVLEAISAPRFSGTSSAIDIANRIPRATERALRDDGYDVIRSPYGFTFAAVHAIHVDRDGRWSGAADPGRDGMAMAV